MAASQSLPAEFSDVSRVPFHGSLPHTHVVKGAVLGQNSVRVSSHENGGGHFYYFTSQITRRFSILELFTTLGEQTSVSKQISVSTININIVTVSMNKIPLFSHCTSYP